MNIPDEKIEIKKKEVNFFIAVVIDNVCRALRNGYPTAIVELKQLLLKGKITPKSIDEHGCSILHAACQGGLLEVVIDLFQKGYGFESDKDGNTPLHIAYLFCHKALIDWLISRGQNPYVQNRDGLRADEMTRDNVRKALFSSCLSHRVESVIAAVGKGWILVSDQDERGRTLLHYACENGDRALASKLLSLNSDVNAPDAAEDLPMHLAMANGHVHVAEFLLERGADIERRNGLQMTAWDGLLAWCRREAAADAPPGTSSTDPAPPGADPAPPLGSNSPASARAAQQLARAGRMYCRGLRRFLNPGVPAEVAQLRREFDEHCALGTEGLGVDNVRTGRSGQSSRDQTMDYLEFCQMLKGRLPHHTARAPSKALLHAVYKQVSGGGELDWPGFVACLLRLATELGVARVFGVPVAALAPHHCESPRGGRASGGRTGSERRLRTPAPAGRGKGGGGGRVGGDEADLLQPVTAEYARSSLQTLQRRLNAMAGRAQEVTACEVFTRGPGLTTGRHRVSQDTLDVYRQLLTFPGKRLKCPGFDRPDERRKRDFLAKSFFREIDADQSGSLTCHELGAALDDYGFTPEERAQVFARVDADGSGAVSLGEFVRGVMRGDVRFDGRVSRSRRGGDSDLRVALAASRAVARRVRPERILSLSPGLFGQIFRIYAECAMTRLSFFGERTRVYRAPRLSAPALPGEPPVRKAVVGINTRFAVVNPFDPRVLAAFSPPPTGTPGPSTPGLGRTAYSAAGFSEPASPGGSARWTPAASPGGCGSTRRTGTPAGAPSSPGESSARASTPSQAGAPDYRDQARAIHPGLLQGLSPARRRAAFAEPEVARSPDGRLLSEHTRVTLLPHRLTATDAGQLLFGGVETDEAARSPGTVALQAVRRHQVTAAGLALLHRVVFRSLSAGAGHCAGVSDSGLVYTWGQGRYGQLGHGDDVDRIIPQPVEGIRGVTRSVSAGFYHTVAGTVAGAAFTWGDGREGKLGHGDDASRPLPTLVSYFAEKGLRVSAAQAGGSHTVVLSAQGQVYTFGSGLSGRLGHGDDADQHFPVLVAALEFETCVSVAAGHAHTAALCGGCVFTWGSGRMGRLGHGTESDEVLPRRMELISHPTIQPLAVAAGEAHTCVFRSDGSVVTIGRLTHGRHAEGCTAQPAEALTEAMALQSPDDWFHFSS